MFRPPQDSSVWLGLTSIEQLMSPECSKSESTCTYIYIYIYIYIYMYTHTNFPVNAIVKLPHP